MFNKEYHKSISSDKITENMGKYLMCLANNVVARFRSGNSFILIEELHQHILLDALERFFIVETGTSPFGVFSIMMFNKAKNFLRDTGRGTRDIYGVRVGYGRGSKWIKKDFRKLKFEHYGTIEDMEAHNAFYRRSAVAAHDSGDTPDGDDNVEVGY